MLFVYKLFLDKLEKMGMSEFEVMWLWSHFKDDPFLEELSFHIYILRNICGTLANK